jgi:hypothetical protein
MGLPERSSWFPGTEVDGVRDGSWKRRHVARLYWAAKAFPYGGQCGWASLPPTPSYGLWLSDEGQRFMSGAALSHRAAMGGGSFSGGVKPLGLNI